MESYDHEVEDGKTDHRILAFEVFTTDRAYVTKDELKQLKKGIFAEYLKEKGTAHR